MSTLVKQVMLVHLELIAAQVNYFDESILHDVFINVFVQKAGFRLWPWPLVGSIPADGHPFALSIPAHGS